MRQFVEMMCNGEFLDKDPENAWDYFDQLAENAQSWDNSDQSIKTKASPSSHWGMHVIRENDDVSARLANLTRKFEAMELKKGGKEKIIEKENICGICETNGHMTQDCPTIPAFKEVLYEQVNATNTY